MALLFAFYVHYIPFHLLSETHWDDAARPPQSAAGYDEHHRGADHDDHDGHHTPHSASDHAIQILPKSESLFFALVFLPAASALVIEAPELLPGVPVIRRIKPPGESPPDPRQPRAPPLS